MNSHTQKKKKTDMYNGIIDFDKICLELLCQTISFVIKSLIQIGFMQKQTGNFQIEQIIKAKATKQVKN